MQTIELPGKPPWRIETSTGAAMFVTAMFYDTLQFGVATLVPIGLAAMATAIGIPVGIVLILIGITLSVLITCLSFFTFFIWFQSHNVSLGLIDRFAIKRFAVQLLTYLADVIFGIIPCLTIGTVVTIAMVTAEDRQRRREWEGKLGVIEKALWEALKSGRNPRAALVRILRDTALERTERVRLQRLMQRAAANDNARTVGVATNDNMPRRSTAPLRTNTAQSPHALPRAA